MGIQSGHDTIHAHKGLVLKIKVMNTTAILWKEAKAHSGL